MFSFLKAEEEYQCIFVKVVSVTGLQEGHKQPGLICNCL